MVYHLKIPQYKKQKIMFKSNNNSLSKPHLNLLLTLFILLYTSLLPLYSKSVQPLFDQYTIKDGLSHNTVNCIVQDSLSYMWFGTMDGLNRFDGYQFKVFKSLPDNSNSLCHNLVKSICIDKDGGMWIGTARGLSYLHIASNQFTNYFANDSSNLSYNNIEMVFCDREGTLWVATMGGGLNKFDKKTRRFTQFKFDKNKKGSLSNNNVHWISEDQEGTIWVGTEGGGLNRLKSDSTNFDFFQFEPEDGNYQALNCVRSIQEDYKGNIWVGTWGGGTAFLDKKEEQFHYFRKSKNSNKGVSDSRVISILSSSNSQIWFGTEDGGLNRFLFENQTFEHIEMDQLSSFGLKSNNIRAIYEDKNHRIWLGSLGGGVFSFRSGKADFSGFKIQDRDSEEIPNQDIYAITGNSESLTIGTNGSGLYHAKIIQEDSNIACDNIEFKKIKLSNSIVHTLCYDNWGRLWAGTLGGGLNLIEFSKEKDEDPKITNFNIHANSQHTVSYNDIRTLYNDRLGNLWIGTAGGGLDKLVVAKRGEFYFEHYKHNESNVLSISNNDIRAISEDKNGTIWIGTSFGLNKAIQVNGQVQFESFYSNSDETGTLSANWINALFVDIHGILWVGTDAGLNRLDPETNKFKVYTEKNGLVNNIIKSIKGDKQGNIWIGTVNGISMYNQSTGSFYNFYESDGLLSNEFNAGAIYTNQSGQLFLGGTKGLNYFIPKNILKQNQIHALHLTDLKLFNQSVKVGETINDRVLLKRDVSLQQSIRLKYNENSFSFEFSALDYSNAEKIKYQYKLEGFNDTWQNTDASHRFATYTNLGGGNYTFRVKAITGVPNDRIPECTIDLIIDYPIWLRWWSFIVYALFSCGIIYVIIRYSRNKAMFREELNMSKIQREKEQELINLKQRFFMNMSHELKTPLTLILGPVERISKNEELTDDLKPVFTLMQRNANRLSLLINQLMDFSKQERGVLKLSVRKIEVIRFINDVTESFRELAQQKAIQLNVDTSSSNLEAWIDEEKMEKILFNLLSNAFKYTPIGGKITIKVNSHSDDFLTIEVIDTGKGIDSTHHKHLFDRFYQVDQNDSETGTGIGLSLVKEFVSLHHGSISVESKIEKGSRFTIQIPLLEKTYLNDIKSEPIKLDRQPITSNKNKIDHNKGDKDQSKPTILIVEDNNDMCSYLDMILSEPYNTLTATDGMAGLKIALKEMPDVILSDIMMPNMDGISFCNKVKNNVAICHIPVLLLTAKSGKENTLSGFKSGADDYVEKPFNTEILIARIQSLVENRNRIMQQLQKNPIAKVTANNINQLDRKFLEDIEKIAINNLTSIEFSVEELGKQVGMSRTTLYRKIKGLLDQTPIEYIRTIRLKEALKLLENGNSDITFIAESVGFKDVVYFRNCFKKLFNVTPEQI